MNNSSSILFYNFRRCACFFLLITTLFFTSTLSAQNTEEEYYVDELIVTLSIPRVGTGEIAAAIIDDQALLSVVDLFNLLKIKVDYSPGFDKITGFIVDEDAHYIISRDEQTIEFKGKKYQFSEKDFFRTETTLYINTKLFELFGLELNFSFRALGVTLNTQVDLPIIREIRLREMRENIKRIQGEVTPDTTFKQGGAVFNIGNIDWNLYSNQQVGGKSDTRLNLAVGSHLLGGEGSFTLNIGTDNKFNLREQDYYWRYANNQNKIIRQISAGRVASSGKIHLSAPIAGVSISNAPTTYRRSFGTYILSETTEPHWTVELYVNNILVDYTQADASGFYSFEVPLVYGETMVKLQFYGPYGEERSEERALSIPFNFLPKGTMEYQITGGVTEDSELSKYGRADFNYGFGRSFSAGAGIEYYSALVGSKFMPYGKASLKLLPEMLISAEYVHNLKLQSILSYRIFKNLNLEANYLIYDRDQTAYPTSILEESKLSLSFPIRGKKFSLFSRVGAAYQKMHNADIFAPDLILSAGYGPLSVNISTQARFYQHSNPFIYSLYSLSLRLPRGFIISPQAQYNWVANSFSSARVSIDKQFSSFGSASISYDRNFTSKSSNIDFGIRFDLSFMRFSVNARRTGKDYSFSQSMGGGIIIDAKSRSIEFRNRGAKGRGGLIIVPFLDINGNGIMDADEKPIPGININVNGGVISRIDNNTTLKVLDLEAYASYRLSINALSTENIAWQLPFENIEVVAEPNRLKRIEIPVFPMAEVSGMVYIKAAGQRERGIGRVIVNIFTKEGVKVTSLLSEPDGFYNFLGLKPGDYYVSLDPVQLERLNLTAKEMEIPFTVVPSYDGDYISGVDLTLLQDETETATKEPIKTTTIKEPEKTTATKEVVTVEEMRYKVQLLAVRELRKDEAKIRELFTPLWREDSTIEVVETLKPDKLYRYAIGATTSEREAQLLKERMVNEGWSGAFVVSFTPSEEKEFTTRRLTKRD